MQTIEQLELKKANIEQMIKDLSAQKADIDSKIAELKSPFKIGDIVSLESHYSYKDKKAVILSLHNVYMKPHAICGILRKDGTCGQSTTEVLNLSNLTLLERKNEKRN